MTGHIEMSDNPSRFYTNRLVPDDLPLAPVHRGTGPLDYAMPWVIELRVVGTASVLQVQIRETMVIGRADKESNRQPDIDLEAYRAHHLGVSRRHAVLSARNSRVAIHDEDSANGTYINGERLEPGKGYRLNHGDTVTFGKLELQVFFVVTPSSYEKHQTAFREILIPVIGHGQKILIVEDDAQIARAIGSILEQAGFQYQWYGTVGEALTYIESYHPSLVITELILPDRSGVELIEYAYSLAKPIPVIVVSATMGGYQMGQALEAGADVFLTKPVGIDELLTGIRKIMDENL
jgi:CheY-like chemotaxis protein